MTLCSNCVLYNAMLQWASVLCSSCPWIRGSPFLGISGAPGPSLRAEFKTMVFLAVKYASVVV